jgi:hypothetical protein
MDRRKLPVKLRLKACLQWQTCRIRQLLYLLTVGDMGQSEACPYLMTKSSVPPDYPSREESTRLDIGNHTFCK